MSEYELTDLERKTLDNWITQNILPQKAPNKNYTSYALKVLFEQAPEGFFITNKQFKEAMVRCNFVPVNKNKLNWDFRVSLKSPGLK
jgi:nucleoside recognition membrane protein YjiH